MTDWPEFHECMKSKNVEWNNSENDDYDYEGYVVVDRSGKI